MQHNDTCHVHLSDIGQDASFVQLRRMSPEVLLSLLTGMIIVQRIEIRYIVPQTSDLQDILVNHIIVQMYQLI